MGASSSSPVPAAEAALLHARAAAETTRAAAETTRAAADAAATTRAAADAAAATTRAASGAAAATTRAPAEATRAAAEAAAATMRLASADAAYNYSRAAAITAPFFLGALLAADFYVHDSRGRIRRRMLRTLRACRLPLSVPIARPPLLRVPQPPLAPGFLLTMLLGPTGCGKSTLLDGLARDAAAGDAAAARPPAPVVLVKLRLHSIGASSGGAYPPAHAKDLMDSAAAQFYAQIGYPARRSVIGTVLAHGFTLKGSITQGELDAAAFATSARLASALGMLFSVCGDLQRERVAAGLSEHDAAPVLIFDDVHDLIKDARLAAAGGRLVFRTLATLLVAYGVDRKAVRAVVAGSSAELDFAFDATPARGNRWVHYTLRDPPPADVVRALVARGYAEADARDMVALCGTRLRSLDGPLTRGPAAVDAAHFLADASEKGRQDFVKFFAPLDAPAAAQLARVLDGVAASDAAGPGARPTKSALPPSVGDFSNILYVDRGHGLYFQSPTHARTWPSARSVLAADSAAPLALR
jgi:hypothetical protein